MTFMMDRSAEYNKVHRSIGPWDWSVSRSMSCCFEMLGLCTDINKAAYITL